jgi:integrase/recombinase XerD
MIKSQKTSLIGPLIQSFFTQHLLINKRVSPQTVTSYRDTLKLFLQYLKEQTGKEPAVLQVSDLGVPAVLSFLDHLEQERHNSARSRNVRLAAIRTLFRWIALRDPENVGLATQVLSIPCKRTDKKLVRALSRAETEAILAAPDLPIDKGHFNAQLFELLDDHQLMSILARQRVGGRESESG